MLTRGTVLLVSKESDGTWDVVHLLSDPEWYKERCHDGVFFAASRIPYGMSAEELEALLAPVIEQEGL